MSMKQYLDFKQFVELQQAHIATMFEDAEQLFEVALDRNNFYNLYLDSYPENTNPLYRERREYDCSACRHFIKRFGHVVSIKDGKVTTIWGFDAQSPTFQPVVDALDAYVKQQRIIDVFYSHEKQIGIPSNTEETEDGQIIWDHMNVTLPDAWMQRYRGSDEGAFKAQHRDTRNVFKRSLDTLSVSSVEVVQELILQGTLYRGEEWQGPIEKFLAYKRQYDALRSDRARELFAWEKSIAAGVAIGRIINHAIGTLIEDIEQHTDLEVALRKYEKVVAPANYKRPKAIFTPEMLLAAEKKATELGILESLPRRFATAADINPENIFFPPRHVIMAERAQEEKTENQKAKLSGVFADLASMAKNTAGKTSQHTPMELGDVETVSIERFMRRILPTAKQLDVYLENRHAGNMVSLIAPQNMDAPSMFKWKNPFSWAYSGNVTDSTIKKNVAAAGGDVNGVLRFSIQWNDGDSYNSNDFDAHCRLPGGHISFRNKVDSSTGGNLDVDIIHPSRGQAAVENITWPNRQRMTPGDYQFFVNCFSDRNGTTGFKAEIEFDGQVYNYEYPHYVRGGVDVQVATVHLDRNGRFTITHHLTAAQSSRDVWNVKTNEFVPVTMLMHSPNFWGQDWDEPEGIGNRHYFFMLKDCKNPDSPNGFYNEFLDNRLIEHKRVFEALGARMRVEPSDEQLSGVGFSATKRDSVIVRVTGATQRTFKIEF